MAPEQFPKVILGTAQLSSPYGITNFSTSEKSPQAVLSFLRQAQQLGISTIDTAPAYGAAESLIGMSKLGFQVHTKLDKTLAPEESLKASLAALNVDLIDLLYVHDIDSFKSNPGLISESLTRLLGDRVANVGVSLYDTEELELVLKFPAITHIQLPMNLLDLRFSGDMLKRIQSYGLKCIVRSVFLQGALLADPYDLPNRIEHLSPYLIALRHELISRGISPLEGCLALVCNSNALDGLIIGAQDEAELNLIMEAWDRVRIFPPDLGWLPKFQLLPQSAIDPRRW
jgi:aryl-alcohol dehydrogenase-like predicted oxidoreductase